MTMLQSLMLIGRILLAKCLHCRDIKLLLKMLLLKVCYSDVVKQWFHVGRPRSASEVKLG